MSDLPAFLRDVPAAPSRPPLVDRSPATAPATRRVPGEAGIWVFILGDMLMFGLFFAAFLAQRGQDPDLFARSRETMTVTSRASGHRSAAS